MDQLLHAGEHLLFVRQNNLAIVHADRAAGQLGQALVEQAHALSHLLHPHEVAVITVSHLAVRHIKVELIINEVRMRLAQVVLDVAAAQVRACQAKIYRFLPTDHADVLCSIDKNLVASQQLVRLANGRADFLGELGQFVRPTRRQITRQPANARVCRREPRPGQSLNQVVYFFALGERVQEHRQRSNVHRKRPEAKQMRRDAGQLAANHPDVLAAFRQLVVNAKQLLHRQRVGNVVGQRRKVIEPISVRSELVIRHVLGDLLVAAMQVTNFRISLRDNLAVEFEHQPQHTVRCRVRRSHV